MKKVLAILSLIAVVSFFGCNSINTTPAASEYSYNEVFGYINNENKIDENKYALGGYDCKHFSRDLVQDLRQEFPGINTKVVIVDGIGALHAIVAIEIEGETYLIEPQTDRKVTEEYETEKHPFWDAGFEIWV